MPDTSPWKPVDESVWKPVQEAPPLTPAEKPGPIRQAINTAVSDLNPMNLVGTARSLMHPSTAFAPLAPKTPEEQLPQDAFHRLQRSLGGGPNAPEMRAPQMSGPEAAGHVLAAGVGGALYKAIPKAIDAIPRQSRAIKNFQEVNAAAKDVPVDVSKFAQPTLAARHLNAVTGDPYPPVLKKAFQAIQPSTEPLTFGDSRLLQSSAQRKAVQMSMQPQRLTGPMEAHATRLAKGLDLANEEAAASVGKGQQFRDAMNEYRRAKGLQTFGRNVAKVAVPIGLGAAGYKASKELGVPLP